MVKKNTGELKENLVQNETEQEKPQNKPKMIVFEGDASSPIYEVVSEKMDLPVRICGKSILLKKGEKVLMSKSCSVPLGRYLSAGVKITVKYNK